MDEIAERLAVMDRRLANLETLAEVLGLDVPGLQDARRAADEARAALQALAAEGA